jgi:predicted Ser/Thr protein kinase
LPIQVDGFVCTEELARGGMSLTFLGHSTGDRSVRVVVKVPTEDAPEALQRFRDEIAILGKLQHPGIVRVLGSGTALFTLGGAPVLRPWLAMEYIQGESLRQRLNAVKRLPWREVRKLLGDVVDALAYLADRRICHRDIKPANLIFDPAKGRWVLVDFGIAKALMHNPRLTLTLAGQEPGSWDYMSPEQLDGTTEVDCRTDIYSLGKTAWEALVGVVPRVGTLFPSAMLGEKVVPREADALVARMVAHDPKDRYQTPQRVAEALEVGALRIAGRKKRRKLLRRVLRVAAALLVLAGVAAGAWYTGDGMATKEAAAIYARNKESPTRAVAQLEQFLATHRFWGGAYAKARVEELRPLAEHERQHMVAEYQEVMRDLKEGGRDDEFRLARASNFVKKNEGIFDDAEQIRDMVARVTALELAVLTKKELAEADGLTKRTQELEKKGQIKAALDLCVETLARLRTDPAKKAVEHRRAAVADRFVAAGLKDIDELASKETEDALVAAQDRIKELQQTVGATPETTGRMRRYDEKLWQSCAAKADTSLQDKHYNEASAAVQRYIDNSRVKFHSTEVAAFRGKIAAAEDDGDWKAVSDSAEKNLEQKAFPLALKDARSYLTKRPAGRHRLAAQELEARVAEAHYKQMLDVTDVHDFNAEFKQFLETYPQAASHADRLKKRLCGLACEAIYNTVTDSSLSKTARLDRLRDIDFSRCENDNKDYLKSLLRVGRGYLENEGETQWLWYFEHTHRKVPGDCVAFADPQRVYLIQVSSIEVSMSDAFYKAVKGQFGGDADPRVDLSYGSGAGNAFVRSAYLHRILGAVNKDNFTVDRNATGKPILFFIDVVAHTEFSLSICDADTINPADPKGMTVSSIELKRSGKLTYRWPDGTTFTMTYTSE